MVFEDTFKNLINKGEGERLEFLLDIDYNLIAKTACSFLNSSGGDIIIGVKDNREIVGLEINNTDIDKLRSFLIDNIVPASPISVSIESINNKKILVIEVVSGSKQPYVFDSTIFYRVQNETIKANSNQISELIHNRQQSDIHWERQPALGANIDDLDLHQIHETIKELNITGRSKIKNFDVASFLSYYGLFRDGQLCNAAIVLFGKLPVQFYPQCRVRLTVFSSSKTGDVIEYDKILEGNIFENFNEIELFFNSTIGVISRFKEDKWQREDRVMYPTQALREGVLNALVHRDYSIISGSTVINLYPDRLEISNFGLLPNELSIADLKKNHISFPRNPDIAHICYLRGLIEKIGRGTLKIIEECKLAGLKPPVWTSKSGYTTLTFRAPESNSPVAITTLSERQKLLINETLPGESITVNDYLIRLGGGLTDRSARKDISQLVTAGWFSKIGSGRNTHYRRTDKLND